MRDVDDGAVSGYQRYRSAVGMWRGSYATTTSKGQLRLLTTTQDRLRVGGLSHTWGLVEVDNSKQVEKRGRYNVGEGDVGDVGDEGFLGANICGDWWIGGDDEVDG
jgi:hypothetical protein